MFKNVLKLALGLILVFVITANAQKLEYGIALNSGLYNFNGSGTSEDAIFRPNETGSSGSVSNPYGKKFTFSYGISANVKYIFSGGVFLSADLGYELLRNRIDVVEAFFALPAGAILPRPYINYSGKSTLNQHFVNLFPSIGYRENFKAFSLNFMLGTDLAYCISAKEKYNVVSTTNVLLTGTREMEYLDFDIRPRFQTELTYKKYGFYIGYSVGTTNYIDGPANSGVARSVVSNYIRFGLSYKLN